LSDLGSRIVRGAGLGALLWLTYAVAESLLVAGLLFRRDAAGAISSQYWLALTINFAVFAAAGAILGSLAGALVDTARLRVCLSLSLAATGAAYLALSGHGWRGKAALGFVGTVAILLAWRAVRPSPGRCQTLAGSSFAAGAILALPALLEGPPQEWFRVGWPVIPALAVAAAILWRAVRRGRVLTADVALAAVCLVAALALPLVAETPPVTAASPPRKTGGEARGPNVILIVWDTVRADHLSLYGYARDTTPHLAEFARDATVYRRAIAASSFTLPAHASMFTGQFPDKHGAIPTKGLPLGRPLPAGAHTLAEVLAERGYRTAAIISNFGYLGAGYGLHQGFDYVDARSMLRLRPVMGLHLGWMSKWIALQAGQGRELALSYRRADDIRRQAETLIDGFGRSGEPFFLFLNFMDPHYPRTPPGDFRHRYPGLIASMPYERESALRNQGNHRGATVFEPFQAHETSQYDGAIAFLDAETARLIRALKDAGLYDNTLIIFTSDHGEAFGERNHWGHPVSVYQEQVHVPLLVKFPGTRGGAVSDELASHIDIMPTALAAAGVKIPPDVDGRDLAATAGNRPVFAYYAPMGEGVPQRIQRRQYAVYLDRWKLVVSSDGRKELYDPWADPGEQSNLYRPDHPVVQEAEALLEPRIRLSRKAAEAGGTLSPRDRERLRSLGYVQ
jgi:arylsulfatase A-like enzyme